MREMFGLDGRTALITGSVRGLGLEIARGLGSAGAHVVLNGRDPATTARAAESLAGEGISASSLAFDVTDRAAVEAALDGSAEPDLLVNNVGQRDRRGIREMDPEDFARLLDVDLVSAYVVSRLFVRRLLERDRPGRIVNISSVMGTLGRAGDVAYASAKSGLEGMTRSLAAELGPYGIAVNAVAAGTFATDVNAALVRDETWSAWLRSRTALGRWVVRTRSRAWSHSCAAPRRRSSPARRSPWTAG